MQPATQKLYNTLRNQLPSSINDERRIWARQIVKQGIELEDLLDLMNEDHKVAYRFLWLLSDVGDVDTAKLKAFLPHFFELRKTYTVFDYTPAFCKYWHLCGIPEVHEAEAIDLCFGWLNNPKAKVSFKYYSMWVLKAILPKYPDLKNEFITSLQYQLELNTATFRKQAGKILNELGD